MLNSRRREISKNPSAKLTREEINKGYHFCPDWDYLLVGPNDPEAEACLCNIETMNKLEDHNYNGMDATIIADSKNQEGNRITTFIVTFPRIVLAEFNTHRALSCLVYGM